MKQKSYIDSHKGITFFFIIFLINFYNSWSDIIALTYLSLHGTYGVLWVLKSKIFPDKQWEQKCSLGYGIFIWLGLSLYWIAPIIIVSGNHILEFDPNFIHPNAYIALCISMYIFGVFLHFVSDMQKYIYLKLNPGNLITAEMFSKIRNVNYFGELLIYLGFSLLAMDFAPLIVILLFFIVIWMPNMNKKDASLSKYENFEKYKSKTSKFFPFLY
tara:strand:- start:1020 stop:1664 length:645 start_codon:yes stop_codon:yes gene_type:complete